jgi:hypothetical protein
MIVTHRRSPDTRAAAVAVGVTLLCLLPTIRGAIAPTEWKNQQTLEIRETGLTKVSLPETTLDLARVDLADLRLIGPGGEEVSYAIQIPAPPTAARHSPRNVRIELQPLSTQITIETGTTQAIAGVVLTTPARDFVKAAEVAISSDGSAWEIVGQGLQLARQTDLEALTLPLGKISAVFLRITINDARTPVVPFTGAILDLTAPDDTPMVPVETEIVKREEFAGETVLTLDLHTRHLPLSLLEITATDPLFARMVTVKQRTLRAGESVEQSAAIGSIFRLGVPQQSIREHLRVPLDFPTSIRRQQIHISNDSSPPLAIQRVKVFRRPIWLIFNAGNAGTYRLLTGNLQVSRPTYDLARFTSDWENLPEAAVSLSKPEPTPGYQRRDVLAETPLLGAKLDVSAWKFRKRVTPAAVGVQELELDLVILAHAARGLGDLRLVRDGRQLPYLLERTSLVRALPLQPVEVNDPRVPHLSRWKFSLPFARLPLKAITLSSSSQLFSRALQIFEVDANHRGDMSRRVLSERTLWSSTPDRPEVSRKVNLVAIPTSDTLYLEIDNGDNPAITLSDAHADHPVVRLFFRSDVEPLHLYYGATGVSPPRYDIELVGQRLMSEQKSPVELTAEEPLGNGSNSGFISGKRGGILLWVSLAVVVGVLLFAIARLLPKPPGPPA